MSDIKYKVVIDDQELVSSFKKHDEIAKKTADNISKNYEKTGKELETTTQKSKGLFSSLAESLAGLAKPVGIAIGSIGLLSMSFINTKKSAAENVVSIIAGFKSIASVVSTTATSFANLFTLLGPFYSLIKQIIPLLFQSSFGLMSMGTNADKLGMGLTGLGYLFVNANSAIGQATYALIGFGSVAAGVVGFAITELIVGIGKVVSWFGDKLVAASVAASDHFAKVEKQAKIFAQTLTSVDKAMGSGLYLIEYTALIGKLSNAYNLSFLSLQKASQELVLVGAQLGLNSNQIQKLIKVSSQYAKINGEDVYDTAVAFGSALNGNSQSVLKYGIKLGEANNQHFMFEKGVNKLFGSLADGEKVLIRYDNLLKQSALVAGVAEVAASALGDSQERTNVLMQRMSTLYGQGSNVVEQLRLKNILLNSVLSNVSENTFYFAGIIGALGGRIAQIIGFFIEWSVKIFLVTKGIKLLQILLQSQFWAEFSQKTLPLVNTSLNNIIKSLAGTEVKITSLGSAMKAVSTISKNQFGIILSSMGLARNGAVGFSAILGVFAAKFRMWFSTIITVIRPLMPVLLRVAGIAALVYAAFEALVKIFKTMEERTQIFSTIWGIIVSEFERGGSVLNDLKNVIVSAFSTIADWGERALGLVIYLLNGMITPFLEMARLFGKKFISEESYNQIVALQRRMTEMNDTLYASGFSLKQFSADMASTAEQAKKLGEAVRMEDILALENDLANAGKNQLAILTETKNKRLSLLSNALKQELITTQYYERLKNLVQIDYSTKYQEELKTRLQAFNQTMQTINAGNTANDLAKLKMEHSERLGIINAAYQQHLISKQTLTNALLENEKYYNQELAGLQINQESTWAQLGEAIKDEMANIGFTIKDVAKSIKDAMISGIGASMQWLGRSLATHTEDWQDLQKNIGNILAGMASMLGNFFIAVGMGMSATGTLLGLSGGAAIAAGMALHVLAGALGTMGGDKKATPMAGSPAIEQNLGPDLRSLPDSTAAEQQRQERQSVLNVTINGDVLDSDETGMRIVRLINDAYDKKGVIVRQGAYA